MKLRQTAPVIAPEQLRPIELANGEGLARAYTIPFDPDARKHQEIYRELMKTLLDLHHTGLERMLEVLRSFDNGPEILNAIGSSSLASSLLLLHGLHPVGIETRVRQALEEVQPLIRGHGGELEIVVAANRNVRIRMTGICSLSSQALENVVQEAISAHAPEIQVIEIEGPQWKTIGQIPLPIVG